MEDDANPPSVVSQRTLFLVNTFFIHTVRLLNNFSVLCEDKLADVHRRILRADATLILLEGKLRSVDGLEGVGEQLVLDTLPDLVIPAPAPESSFEPEGTSSRWPGQGHEVREDTRQGSSGIQPVVTHTLDETIFIGQRDLYNTVFIVRDIFERSSESISKFQVRTT